MKKPHLPASKQQVVEEGDSLPVPNGAPVARVVPANPGRNTAMLAAHRETMTMVSVPSEALLREERNSR